MLEHHEATKKKHQKMYLPFSPPPTIFRHEAMLHDKRQSLKKKKKANYNQQFQTCQSIVFLTRIPGIVNNGYLWMMCLHVTFAFFLLPHSSSSFVF